MAFSEVTYQQRRAEVKLANKKGATLLKTSLRREKIVSK